jgi:sarcosine oxidase
MDGEVVDVAVAGLGAMGAAVAWQAAARGLSVAGFDAADPPHTLGSSHGHSRIIREAYFEHPQYVPLVRRAYALWAELEARAGTRLFQASGGLMMGRAESAVVAGSRRAAAEHAIPVQAWTAGEIRTRVPALAPADDMLGIFEPRAGVLAPERAIEAMLAQARAHGADLFAVEPVLEWRASGQRVEVRTPARQITARRLVLAAGPWMPALLGNLKVPLTVERLVQFWYAAGDDRFVPARFPVFLLETPDGRMLYGLPDQGRGLKLAEHHRGAITSIEAVDRRVTPAETARFHAWASTWIRGLPDGGPADAAVCVYTNTPDGDFVLDWHPGCPRVFVCSACSGHGFKFAPAIGETVTAAVAGEAPPLDVGPFRIARFPACRV